MMPFNKLIYLSDIEEISKQLLYTQENLAEND